MKKEAHALRVLLVDDDEEALSEACEMFKKRGFRADLAHNVSEAMIYLYNKMELGIKYSAIMSEFDFKNAQDGNGMKLLQLMRKDIAFRDTLFIFYTKRHISEEGIERSIAVDNHATHFLKPKDMNRVIIPFIIGELSCVKP